MMTVARSQRFHAAIRGAFLADAASMGTHWIYDPAEMATTVADTDAPEFRTPPSPKYYSSDEFPGHYGPGMLSPYGEQMLFVAEHVASTTGGALDGAGMSAAMLEWATTFGGRPDAAMTTFVENVEENKRPWPECGADDDQAHFYMKIVPAVGRYAGSSELVDRVTQAIQVHQNNNRAIAFGIVSARILEAVISGAPLSEALRTVEENVKGDLEHLPPNVQDQVMQAFARGKKAGTEGNKTLSDVLLEVSHEMMKGKEDSSFYNLAGRSCATPGSFIGPIAIFYKYASTPNAFVPAVRENILASGDTCSRSIFIGAVLAAAGVEDHEKSKDSIPKEWIEKMDKGILAKIDAAIASLA